MAEEPQINGDDVIDVANDDGLDNTEPVMLRQIIAQVVGVVVSLLVLYGYVKPEEGTIISAQAITIFSAIFVLAGLIGGIAGRRRAYAPKTVANIAIENASQPADAVLAPPP